jgi:hypothetical protein
MLIKAQLLIQFWPETVKCLPYVKKRTRAIAITKRKDVSFIIPYKLWHGTKPSLNYIRVFGCKCFVFIDKNDDRDSKFNPRARLGIFINYTDSESQYRMYILNKKEIKTFDRLCVKFNKSIPGNSLLGNSVNIHNQNSVRKRNDLSDFVKSILKGNEDWAKTHPQQSSRPDTVGNSQKKLRSRSQTSSELSNPQNSDSVRASSTEAPKKQFPIIIITKTAKDVGYSFSNRKRQREDNINEKIPRTKETRVKASFTLLAHATDRNSGKNIDSSTNRVPIPINYEDAINDPIWE